MINYKGTRWYKCDFHLHTPASKCFKDQSVTPEQWINRIKELHLNCVAVTDHNTGEWIDRLKPLAQAEGIVLFPGVEITCDTSKIHLLIIFNTDKGTQDVNDFLIRCGIKREDFATKDGYSLRTIFDIAKIANECNAIVIPAHIDEYNGLGIQASREAVDQFFNLEYINAVQFVHKEYLQSGIIVPQNEELKDRINQYYGYPRTEIGYDDIKLGYDCVQKALKKKISMLTFSDNPDSEEQSKHGLAGIGKAYSWIKMDEMPDIEGLRQAFMFSDRNANSFEYETTPYSKPSLWIKSISIQNTTITKKDKVVSIEFSPSLTTIIGGRGSGKSSILRFLRGVFDRNSDISGLEEILKEQLNFFKLCDNDGIGVLKEDSKIIVEFVRDEILYRITFVKSKRERTIEKYNPENNRFDPVTDEFFIDFFEFEQYSQKQIFALAQKPNELRNRIDLAISDVAEIQEERKQIENELNQKVAARKNLTQSIAVKSKLMTEIKDLETKIQLLQQSGISELLKNNQSLTRQYNTLLAFFRKLRDIQKELANCVALYDTLPMINDEQYDESYRDEISRILGGLVKSISQQKAIQLNINSTIESSITRGVEEIKKCRFYADFKSNQQLFNDKKSKLESEGVTDLTDFAKYSTLIVQKQKDLNEISRKESELNVVNERINELLGLSLKKRKLITEKRREFVNLFNSEKIKINIKLFGDKKEFESRLRSILQRQNGFDKSIDTLVNKIFDSKDIENNLKSVKEILLDIYYDKYTGTELDGHFINLIKGLTQEQINNIELLYPEDEIEMTYKSASGQFKPLSIASAGQKTTAILTFILSFGTAPLVLDQPEDDLDNHLVYSLIVDKIKEIKQRRQVIVVTHNANIPVNGDAEYVISMSSDTRNLKIQAEGTIEKKDVKNEICEVMEGGIEAFRIRSRRYDIL